MQQVYQRAQLSKAYFIAAALFVSLMVLFVFPMAAHAEEVPPTDTTFITPTDSDPNTIDQGNPVKTPGTPVATSPTNDGSVDWEWTQPEGGLTPDAPVEDTTPDTTPADPAVTDPPVEADPAAEPVVAAPVEHPSDIIKYGYELSTQNSVVVRGYVDSTENKVTTNVTNSGDYTFKLWSITRENHFSDIAYGFFTVVLPTVVLPVYPPITVPQPVDNSLVATANTTNTDTVSDSYYYGSAKTPAITSSRSSVNENVVTTNSTSPAKVEAVSVPVVKASSQGWMILGLPWYIWLLGAAVGFTAWRWTRMTLHEKE